MGFAKRLWEEEQARGWSSLPEEKYVCDLCVDDYALIEVIQENVISHDCSYCGRSSTEPIAAPIDDLFTAIGLGICSEWTDPVNWLPQEEGEYVFKEQIRDAWDLFRQRGHEVVHVAGARAKQLEATRLGEVVEGLIDNAVNNSIPDFF